MNLLFTSVGRRNYLLEYFKKIKNVRVVACDNSVYAPALYVSDEFFAVPEIYSPDYIRNLLNEAKARNIDAIIPLNDLELPLLAAKKNEFESEGIKILVSDENVVNICFDKLATCTFADNLSVNRIPTFLNPGDALKYKNKNPSCRFIIKPRWGTASIGIEYAENEEELTHHYYLTKKTIMNSLLSKISSTDYENCVLIQRMICGEEYGLDVINNLQSKYKATFIRKKIAMRSGETEKAEAVHNKRLALVGEEIGNKLKHIGILDCDLLVENDKIFLLEMNPRFGGGYPFIHFAGANFPLALVKWLNGENTPNGCLNYKNGFISAKVDKLVRMK